MHKPRLEVILLGFPSALLDGKPLKIPRRKHRILFYYLTSLQVPVTRGEVCELFWPGVREGDARKNLREALSRIRTEVLIPDLIISNEDLIQIDQSKRHVDAVEYYQTMFPLLSSSEMNSTGPLPDWLVVKYKQLMGLAKSMQFLQGVNLTGSLAFQNWVSLQNHSYNYSRVKMIDRMVDHCLSIGDLNEAVLWLGLSLEYDHTDIEKNYIALTTLRDLGMTQSVIEGVKVLEAMFLERGETFPQKFIDIRNQAEASRDTPVKKTNVDWSRPEKGEVKFAGRSEEMTRLNQVYRSKGIILLEGEPGIGKTRLLKEFYNQIPFPPRLVYCMATPLSKGIPFLALSIGLRTGLSGEEWNHISDQERNLLLGYFQDQIKNLKPTAIPDTEPNWAPEMQEVFFAFMSMMESLAANRPVLFIVDNAQWIDHASLVAISFLVEQGFFNQNGVLIIVHWQEELNPVLEQFIFRLKQAKKTVDISLSPLSNRETEQLVINTLGSNPNERLIEKIGHYSGGNPYLIIECLRAIRTDGIEESSFTPGSKFRIPESIKAVVQEKLCQFQREELLILQAGSILGSKFCADVLESMMGNDNEDYIRSLEKLTQIAILKVEPEIEPTGGYSFTHEIEREIIEADIDPAVRRKLHLKAAKALIERRGNMPEIADKLAVHYEIAAELERAAQYWLEAGRYSRSLFSQSGTYKAYERAFKLIEQYCVLFSDQFIRQVICEWADYAYDVSDAETCRELYDFCLKIGQQKKSLLLIGIGYSGLGRVAEMNQEFEEAFELFIKADYFIKRSGAGAEDIENRVRKVIVLENLSKYVEARKVCEEALALTQDENDERTLDALVNLKTQLGILYCFMGEPAAAEKITKDALNQSELVVRRSAKATAYIVFAMAQYYFGKYAESLQSVKSIYETSIALGMRWWTSFLDLISARVHLTLGYLDEAWKSCEIAIEREGEDNPYGLRLMGFAIQGEILRLLGDNARAVNYLQRGIIEDAEDFTSLLIRFLLAHSTFKLTAGKSGKEQMGQTLRVAEQAGLLTIAYPAKAAMLLMDAMSIDELGLINEIEKIGKELRENGFGSTWVAEWMLKGKLSLKHNNTEKAMEYFNEAAQHGLSIRNPWIELDAYKEMLRFLHPGSGAYKNVKNRAETIFYQIKNHATINPIKSAFQKYQKNWFLDS